MQADAPRKRKRVDGSPPNDESEQLERLQENFDMIRQLIETRKGLRQKNSEMTVQIQKLKDTIKYQKANTAQTKEQTENIIRELSKKLDDRDLQLTEADLDLVQLQQKYMDNVEETKGPAMKMADRWSAKLESRDQTSLLNQAVELV